ncbi:MAG: dehydrogenase E1 component, partial [Parcubacteria group bacterium GW2011_GWA2_50_10]
MLKLHLEFYKKLYLIRRAEEKIREHYSEDEMKTPMHMSMGEEAIVVGVLEAAGKKSQAFGTYRSHALYLAKTGESDMFFAEMYGKAAGPAKGKAGSMHIALPDAGVMMTSAVVGTTIPVALGAALANAYLKNKRVVVSFFGDGAVNEGVFWESLNFACLKKLPILFVCEDNDFAIHSRLKERLGHKPIAKVASQFYCHTDAASTTDVYEIYEMTRNMLAKMEKSGMPGFLHMKYYRY